MAARSKIVDLRNLLAERFPQPPTPPEARLPTGLTPLDQAIGGGLAKGAITELTSPHPSAGSALMISLLLQAAQQERYFLALIDGRDSFDPSALGELGNSALCHLLWGDQMWMARFDGWPKPTASLKDSAAPRIARADQLLATMSWDRTWAGIRQLVWESDASRGEVEEETDALAG